MRRRNLRNSFSTWRVFELDALSPAEFLKVWESK
jgi:hypothetical protein